MAVGPAACAPLLELLQDPDRAVRTAAGLELVQLLPHDRKVIESLVDDVAAGVVEAGWALRQSGGRRETISTLVRALRSGSGSIDVAALLFEIDPSRDEAWDRLQATAGGESEAGNRAREALVRELERGLSPRRSEALTAWFSSEQVPESARLAFAVAWADVDAPARERDPALTEAILGFLRVHCKLGARDTRRSSAVAILRTSRSEEVALAALMDLLIHVGRVDEDLENLYAFQRAGDAMLPRLTRLALDPEAAEVTRQWAAYIVGGMAGNGVHAMRKLLRDGDPDVRRWVVDGVWYWRDGEWLRPDRPGEFDAGARATAEAKSRRAEAIALVEPLLEDEQRDVRLVSAIALVLLDRSGETWERAFDAAVAVLDSCSEEDRELCVSMVSRLGYAIDRGDFNPMRRDDELRAAARDRFAGRLDRRVRDVDRPDSNRTDCAQALAASPRSCDRVAALLASDDESTAADGAWALRFVDDEKAAAIKALVGGLQHRSGWVRLNAAESLIAMEEQIGSARALLEELAAGPDGELAESANETLKQLKSSGDGEH